MQLTGHDIQRFLDWWFAGLRLLLPRRFQNYLGQSPPLLLIKAGKTGYSLSYIPSSEKNQAKSWDYDYGEPPLLLSENIEKIKALEAAKLKVILALMPHKVLKKAITLPASTKASLRQILKFELDKHTPFSHEQVYYSWQITDADTKRDKIRLNLYILPKKNLDDYLSELDMGGIKADIVTVDGLSPDCCVNLLEETYRQKRGWDLSKMALPIAAAGLFFTMLYLPLWRQSMVLQSLEEGIDGLRNQAAEVQIMMDNRNTIVSRLRFLEDKRTETTPPIEVIRELTAILPDDTWVERLIIDNNELQITGESDAASVIIKNLEDSTLFSSAEFRASVVKDSGSNKDRFQMASNITVNNDD